MNLKYFVIVPILLLGTTVLSGQTRITAATVSFTFIEKEVEGSISGFNGTSTIDRDDPGNSSFSGTVAVNTLKTGNFIRDWHLKGRSYFNADEYPTIAFKSTAVSVKKDILNVDGILTLKGIAKPIQLQLSMAGDRLKGYTTLYTSDFDITIIKKERKANEVRVRFDFLME